MSSDNTLTETDLLHRILTFTPELAAPLVKYLKIDVDISIDSPDKLRTARYIVDYVRKMGGHELANLVRKEGVSYSELVYDVGKKLKAPDITEQNSVLCNEELILSKVFGDAFDRMSAAERIPVLDSIGLKNGDVPVGAAGAIIAQLVLKQFGGFGIYRMSVVVANIIARALLGSGLSFAANAMITRTLGALLGPVGWVASGAWFANDLAGPAYRKTIPFVIHFAALRQLIRQQINICVTGDASAGKDALMRQVFGIPGNISPVAGATGRIESHQLKNGETIWVHNLPGFNDPHAIINQHTSDFLHVADTLLVVVDLNRGISDVDIQVVKQITAAAPGKPLLICLNKVDLLRPDVDISELERVAKKRLGDYPMIRTAFDPDPRLGQAPLGAHDIFVWICDQLEASGKDVSQLKKLGLQ